MHIYETLTGADLARIINEKNHVVIMTDQLTANTVGQPQSTRLNFNIPVMTDKDLQRIVVNSVFLGFGDRKSLWNTFIIVAANLGATITYININNVDCQVDIQFN